jgi:hypothetical protein
MDDCLGMNRNETVTRAKNYSLRVKLQVQRVAGTKLRFINRKRA